MTTLDTTHTIQGPWSLRTSKQFWEGFTPSALSTQNASDDIRAVFLCDTDWRRVDAVVTQHDDTARIVVTGPGDLDAATAQVRRFLSLDIDGREWPEVGRRDSVIGAAQQRLPGFRPCGFYSPYEAAAWSVLSQRISMKQAAAMKTRLTQQFGDDGAFPAPAVLLDATLELPGRKAEYLRAVAEAALDGRLSGGHLRSLAADEALADVQSILGLGPFAAELVVIRGANFPDVLPQNEARLSNEIVVQYGGDRSVEEISAGWRPFRSWAAVNLRALREERAPRRRL
jgi:DNA-3-methyladenine glycosylase II